MADERPRRLSESSRVEAFSDGVFSIAFMLLVLELAIPAVRGQFGSDLSGAARPHAVADALRGHDPAMRSHRP